MKNVLDRWEAGVNLIESYDLSMELVQKTYIDRDKTDGSWKFLADAYTFPGAQSRIYRKGARRRGEFGGDGRSHYTSHLVWNGQQAVTFQESGNAVVEPFIVVFGSVQQYEDYEAYFHNFSGTTDQIALAKSRESHLLPREGRLYVVDIPTAKEGNFANCHWRVWLDKDKNYMPVKIVQWFVNQGAEKHSLEMENELCEVAPGVYAPIRSRARTFFGDKNSPLFDKVIGVNELTVIGDRSRWNIDLPDSLFDMAIPNGTTVLDRSRNAVYTQGSDNVEKFVTQLADDEKKKLANVPPKDRGS